MYYKDAIGEVIREERLAQGMTMRSLADSSPIAIGYLSEVERGQKEASSQVLERIAIGLGKETYELIVEAGMKMYRDSLPDVVYLPDKTAWAEQYSDLIRT
jgi:transcriptional regulator with XRE-family HTH domain